MHVSCEFSDLQIVMLETILESSHYFRDQSFHRSYIHDLKLVLINNCLIFLHELTDSLHNGQHSDVGFPSASRCTNQQVLLRFKSCLINFRLDQIQRFDLRKSMSRPFWHRINSNTFKITLDLHSFGWNNDLFISILLEPFCTWRKHYFCIGHQTSTLLEGQFLHFQALFAHLHDLVVSNLEV